MTRLWRAAADPRHIVGMRHGRLVRVLRQDGDVSETAIYAVAIEDPQKAVQAVREVRGDPDDRVETPSRVSRELLDTLGIAPGGFKRM